jgi:hypothetical protein
MRGNTLSRRCWSRTGAQDQLLGGDMMAHRGARKYLKVILRWWCLVLAVMVILVMVMVVVIVECL